MAVLLSLESLSGQVRCARNYNFLLWGYSCGDVETETRAIRNKAVDQDNKSEGMNLLSMDREGLGLRKKCSLARDWCT